MPYPICERPDRGSASKRHSEDGRYRRYQWEEEFDAIRNHVLQEERHGLQLEGGGFKPVSEGKIQWEREGDD